MRFLVRVAVAAAGRTRARQWLVRPGSQAARRRSDGDGRARVSADSGAPAAGPWWGRPGGGVHRRTGGGDRPALGRRRPDRAHGSGAGSRPGPPGSHRGGHGADRRDHGRGHRRLAFPDRHRPRLLQHDRLLPGRVRGESRARMDGGPHPLVRGPAGDGRAHRGVPGPSRGDHGARRPMARGAGRGRARPRAPGSGDARGRDGGRGGLPPGRAPSPARGAHRGGGGLPAREPLRLGSATRSGAVAPGAGAGLRRGRTLSAAGSARPAIRWRA